MAKPGAAIKKAIKQAKLQNQIKREWYNLRPVLGHAN